MAYGRERPGGDGWIALKVGWESGASAKDEREEE
jgi:hypothetical protein